MHDIFYFTDIHGMYDLYHAIMSYCKEQDPDAMIIFGGDACDRGRDGYKIMKELLNNWNVVYLKGNHEDMFVQAACEVLKYFKMRNKNEQQVKAALYSTMGLDNYKSIQLALYNGGLQTLTDWILDGQSVSFIDKIDNLPLTFSIGTYDFCHAGSTYSAFKKAADAEYNNKEVDSFSETSLLWDRTALNIGWAPNRACIFGHTPVPHVLEATGLIWEKDVDILPYKYIGKEVPELNGEKICMDTAAAYFGNAYVLNVLTMQAQGFEDIDVITKEIRKHSVKKIGCIQV